MKSVRSHEFGQLRARIEATFSSPALLVVTSAVRGDGKTATAFGLAEAFAAAHHRVLFVDANAEAPTLARIHHLPATTQIESSDLSRAAVPVAGRRFDGISVADPRFEAGMSMESVKVLVAHMRLNYDFIIADTAALIKSDLAVLLSTVADGTLLTLRFGRLPSSDDERTVATLQRVGATVVGLLTVDPAMIKNFAAARQEIVPTIRVPARHVTTHHSIAADGSYSVVEAAQAKVPVESTILK